jgi:hypothetical protein
MPWEARTNKAGNYGRPRRIGGTTLYNIFMTNYERNTETGEIRPSQSANHRGAHYIEVPKTDPKFVQSETFNATNELGIPFAHRDNSGKTFLLVGYLDNDGKMQSSGNAGAALAKDYAQYNSGKQPEFTRGLLEFADSQTRRGEATSLNQTEGLVETDSDGLPVADATGTTGTTVIGDAAEAAEAAKEREANPQGDTAGDRPPGVNLVTTDPVRITKKRGVLGFEDKPDKQFRYPLAMINEQTDYLLIAVAEYNPAGRGLIRSRGELDSNTATSANKTYAGSIILPIPSNIQDGNSVKYGDSSLDGVTAAVAGTAIGVMAKGGDVLINPAEAVEKIKREVKDGTQKLSGMGDNLAKLITQNLAAQAASLVGLSNVTGAQLLARETGGILNPNQELLFSGVTLRSFRFSFKMNPRNEDEAREIKSIIRVFKSNMAAKTTEGGVFLSTPNVFDLTYMSGDQPHPFLHVFKTCALTDMSVNYTGDGLYATYGGKEKTPISMVMDLTFKELEAIYDEDYEKIEQGVGY